jgi:hypothetical protein
MYMSNKRAPRFSFPVLFVALFTAASLASCSSSTSTSDTGTDTTATTVSTDKNEQPESAGSWKVLFDGNNTDAWRGFKKDTLPQGWQVKEGTLTLVNKGAGDIITKDEYENFELELEWKISEGGNSGIFYNVVEDTKYNNTYETGPEMQVLDNERHPDAKAGKNGNRTAGSNYDLIPTSQPAKPAGEWNQVKLVVNKGHVEHWLNGTKVVEYQLWSPEWEKMVAGSKFVSMPDYGKAKKGHIALQDHGDPVWFRNIRIREL